MAIYGDIVLDLGFQDFDERAPRVGLVLAAEAFSFEAVLADFSSMLWLS